MYKVKIKKAWIVMLETESDSFPVSMPLEYRLSAEERQKDIEEILRKLTSGEKGKDEK